jgi:hypothetical protein
VYASVSVLVGQAILNDASRPAILTCPIACLPGSKDQDFLALVLFSVFLDTRLPQIDATYVIRASGRRYVRCWDTFARASAPPFGQNVKPNKVTQKAYSPKIGLYSVLSCELSK